MEKQKKFNLHKKTPPSTPNLISNSSPSTTRIQIFQNYEKKTTQDYSREIEKWISLFKSLNVSIEQLYEMCCTENIIEFTYGAIDTIKHSLDEFQLLASKQQQQNMNVDITDPTGSVDGELLRQYLDDGLQPAEVLMLLIKEKAADQSETSEVDTNEVNEHSDENEINTQDDHNEEIDNESWEDVSLLSFDSDKKCRSLSPGRKQYISKLKEKLQRKPKPSALEIQEKSDQRQRRAEYKRNINKIQRQEKAIQRRRQMKKAKQVVELNEAEKKKAIELQITLKQIKADERYEAHLNNIRNRAKSENLKPNEVAFMSELQAEEKKICREEKKMTLDNKISETRERRLKVLEEVKLKQLYRSLKEEAAEKKRQALEYEKVNKYLFSQQKLEEAENRRHRLLEIKKNTAENLSKKRLERSHTVLRVVKRSKKGNSDKEDERWDSDLHSSLDDNKSHVYSAWVYEKSPEDKLPDLKVSEKVEEKDEQTILWCSVCNYVLVENTTAQEHNFGEKHRIQLGRALVQGNIPDSVIEISSQADLANQREQYVKKRLKKIKQLYNSRCLKHDKASIMGKETSGVNKNRLQKLSLDLDKCITNIIDYETAQSVLKDTIKLLDQRKEADLHVIRQLKFIPCIMEIVKKVWSCPRHELKYVLRLLETISRFLTIFSGLSENRTYLEVTNRLIPLIDLVSWILNKSLKDIIEMNYVPQIFHLLTILLKHRLPSEHRHFRDYFVEYLLNSHLLSKLKQKLTQLQGPLVLNSNNFSLLLLKCVAFLEALTIFPGWGLGDKPAYEVSVFLTENFLYLLQESELAGIPYLLLCLLLNENPAKRTAPKVIPQTLLAVTILSIRFLNNLARLHLPLLQEMLSNEEYYVNIYHLFDYILRYCSEHLESGPQDVRELLHEIILLIGYFVSLNSKNQNMMKLGETSIIQRLCSLPLAYFTDKKYINVLFPTLIAICYENCHNYSILQHEMSVDLLINYIKQQTVVYADENRTEDHKSESRSKRSLSISSSNSYSKSILAAASLKLVFLNRFPRDLWENALQFFSTSLEEETQ
jgi:hypothetical protein